MFSPQDKNIRPTTDFVKENLYNIIQNDIMGIQFLDIFAGSGAIGIEALSRGAKSCTFLDCSQKSIDLLRKNLEKTRLANYATIIKGEIPAVIKKLAGQRFDIIFLDPPYFKGLADKCLCAIIEQDILDKDGFIVLEIASKEDFNPQPNLEVIKEKIYGASKLIFLQVKSVVML